MFETFNVPGLMIGNQDVLSLYSSARTIGVIINSGECVSHVVPIYEGYPLLSYPNTQLDTCGRDVTIYLQRLLRVRHHACLTWAYRSP